MNRSVVDRAAIEAEVARRRASQPATGYGSWVAAKVFVIPAAVAGLVNRILHRSVNIRPAVPESLRRHAGVYVWRPTFGPDGKPDSYGEIVPLSEAALPRRRHSDAH